MRKEPANSPFQEGATLVITHRVKPDKHAEYEQWTSQIAPHSRTAPGSLDWNIIRPIAGLSDTYTVIIRFDTEANLKQWIDSPLRAELVEKVEPLLVSGDDFFISSGLDFWFTPPEAKAKVPVRWKQYLITWSAIYPLVLGMPWLLAPLLKWLGIAESPALSTLLVTGMIVFLMVYVIMPRYTQWIHRWLFR